MSGFSTIPGVPKGTAFPSAPATGYFFYRTDRNIEYFYDGTRWLSTQLLTLDITGQAESTALTLSSAVPYRGTYSIYITSVITSCFITATGDWTITISSRIADNSATTLATQNQAVVTTWVDATTTVNAVLDTNARAILLVPVENSGTATLFFGASINYRLVG